VEFARNLWLRSMTGPASTIVVAVDQAGLRLTVSWSSTGNGGHQSGDPTIICHIISRPLKVIVSDNFFRVKKNAIGSRYVVLSGQDYDAGLAERYGWINDHSLNRESGIIC